MSAPRSKKRLRAPVGDPVPVIEEAPPPPPREPPPPRVRLMLCAEFARGLGSLGAAFLAEHRLQSKTTVKLEQSAWQSQYDAFLTSRR